MMYKVNGGMFWSAFDYSATPEWVEMALWDRRTRTYHVRLVPIYPRVTTWSP